jgi:hypothetical protein
MTYQIGSTRAGMVSLESLGLTQPSKAQPVDYLSYLDLGNGQRRGAGSLQTSWRFAYLTAAQLSVLRGYCSGSSAAVYIQTLAGDGTYRYYSAVMLMAQPQEPKTDALLDYVIEYRNLVEVA